MKNKDLFYTILKENNGKQNEIELGRQLGLSEDQTQEIIAQLLSEHKIEYLENGASDYTIMAKAKNKNN